MKDTNLLREAIEQGDLELVRQHLVAEPGLANETIRWGENQKNHTDPLHYVSDCVFNQLIGEDAALEIARVLITGGAALEGSEGRETPLIGATSLGAEAVACYLLEQGADPSPVSVFGANALHWAAYMGLPDAVAELLAKGAEIEQPCNEFAATPLFWAAQGFSRHNSTIKRDHLGAARTLLERGANPDVRNVEGVSAVARAADCDDSRMAELISAYQSQG